ncbi:hypothetical protein B0J14DRAFT_679020 [Halenospora varia]|nr:hypothetical protein B0J14DRAFT_679020 [Halenospora varia]
MGMAISSFLAYLKGVLSWPDLERILNCILDMGPPFYVMDYDCCNADVLWEKIRTDGMEHKDGVLYLAMPNTIGGGTFLDNILDIDAGMVSEAVLNLRRYADQYTEANRLTPKDGLVFETSNQFLSNGEPSPFKGNESLSDAKPSIPTTAGIIGTSGYIGFQLVGYLLHNNVRVICTIRSASLHSFKKRTNLTDPNPRVRVLTGNVLDLANLPVIIQEVDALYNMVGVVTISSKPNELARVIALNGFAQGIITHLIQEIGRDQDVKVLYPSASEST